MASRYDIARLLEYSLGSNSYDAAVRMFPDLTPDQIKRVFRLPRAARERMLAERRAESDTFNLKSSRSQAQNDKLRSIGTDPSNR